MDYHKEKYLRYEFLTWSVNGALGRSKTYSESATEDDKEEFRNALRKNLDAVSRLYQSPVTEEEHLSNLIRIADDFTSNFPHCLENKRFRIGITQKALNLYLKYLWCVGLVLQPPHCPFDSIVIKRLPNCRDLRWTSIDTIEDYQRLVKNARRVADVKSIAEWELEIWTDSIQTAGISGTYQATGRQGEEMKEPVSGWGAVSAKFHDGLKEAMMSYQSSELTTAKINTIVKGTPRLADQSPFIFPSDHCINHTNKGACWCAQTENAIFEKICRGVYSIRDIRDFENDFIPPQEDINTGRPSGDQVMQLNEYIESILPLIKASRKFRSDNSHAAKHVRYLYAQAFYGFDQFAKRKASVEAKKLYSSRGFTNNLSQRSVDNQRQFDPEGRRNGDFHLEHVFTGSGFRKAVENLSEEDLTIENIETIVNEKFICAWILKTEDAKLDEAGYRTNRPENPIDAYTEVGIILED